MCFKAGDDELDTVKNLMSLGVSAVVAEALDVEIDEVKPESRLVQDLGMTPAQAETIKAGIAEYFDGLEIDMSSIRTFHDLLEVTVYNEFRDLEPASAAAEEFEYRMAA